MDSATKRYNIRSAKEEDSQRIWEIRNHPLNRRNFNNPEEIDFASHQTWFANKYFKNIDNYCLVLEVENMVIGYCRFDLNDDYDYYLVSIALHPDSHGQGLGHNLLAGSLKKIVFDKDIKAEVKKENIPSVKVFQKNNFVIYKEDDKNYYFKYEAK